MVNENSLGAAVAAIGEGGLDLGDGPDLGDETRDLSNDLLGEPSTLAEIGGKGKDGLGKRDLDGVGVEFSDQSNKRIKLDGTQEGNEDGLLESTLNLDPTLDPALAALEHQHQNQHHIHQIQQGNEEGQPEVDLGLVSGLDVENDNDNVEVDFQALQRLGSIGSGVGIGDGDVDYQALARLERHFAAQGQVGLTEDLGLGGEGEERYTI